MRRRHVPRVAVSAATAAVLTAVLAGCGGSRHSPEALTPTTTAPPARTTTPATTVPVTVAATPTTRAATPTTSTTTASTTTASTTTASTTTASTTTASTTASTTTTRSTTTAPPRFPAIVNQAMEALQPPPSGMEAPAALPTTPAAAISAEANKSLDGSYSVTLIATPKPEPVNSPDLGPAAANPSSDLGTFSTTPVDTTQAAVSYLGSTLTGCSGPQKSLSLTGTTATICSTAQGPAVGWSTGTWKVQVINQGGTATPTPQAAKLASWLAGHSLPQATQGVITVTVAGGAQAGTAVTSAVIWYVGHDVYQVSAPGSELGALDLAASMEPWPGG